MESVFAGRSILVAEDEPLIALEITQAFEERGARVIVARTLRDALLGVEDPRLSVAILDHVLGTQNSSTVCERMKALGIPFVTYSGLPADQGACAEGVHVNKPARAHDLVQIVKNLLATR